MKVLVIGSGGREHVLAERLSRSEHVERVYCAPGNAGTAMVGENVPLAEDALPDLVQFAKEHRIDLTVVGPETPLCAGLVDRFQEANLPVFGPTAAAARLEGDKGYAKRLMRDALVPTAEGRVFTRFEDAKAYVASRDTPQVVKAAGLAGGKGTVVCDDPADAILALEQIMLQDRLGEAGRSVIVEEKLKGAEVSVFAVVDGHTLYVLEPACDHKRLGEGETGPNTGGMGSYSPAPTLDDATLAVIDRDILVPILSALERDGAAYRGFLYTGIMLTPGGPKVLEFNCRFGDPEAQVVLPRLQTDLFELLHAAVRGRLEEVELGWGPKAAVCVVLASAGYPEPTQSGGVIRGLEDAGSMPDVLVYHAGTRRIDRQTVAVGGRVLGITGLGPDLPAARQRAYAAVERVSFKGAYYRGDIAAGA